MKSKGMNVRFKDDPELPSWVSELLSKLERSGTYAADASASCNSRHELWELFLARAHQTPRFDAVPHRIRTHSFLGLRFLVSRQAKWSSLWRRFVRRSDCGDVTSG